MAGSDADAAAVEWLLNSTEPAIRGMTRRDLLGEPRPDDLDHVLDGPLVKALFAGQQPDGRFHPDWYRKWVGAHWRLISMVELEVPPGERRAVKASETVLDVLARQRKVSQRSTLTGLTRSHASIEGNALAVACRLGLAGDARVRAIAEALVVWQWPDGGWNCDGKATGRRSSFHETHAAMWGLHEFATATGDTVARDAAGGAAELLLAHRIFRRHGTGEPIHPSWTVIHYPPYWHYDVLQAMTLLRRMGRADDERASDALELIASLRGRDGRWRPGARWWRRPGATSSGEVADWSEVSAMMTTLNAMRALMAARS